MALTTVPASLSATALTLTTAAQPNITSVGTLTGLTVSGNIAGTLTTAAQTNITSVGTLTGLALAGNVTLTKTSADALFKIVTGGGNDAILELDAPGASGAQSHIKFSDSGTVAGSIIYAHNSSGTDYMTFGTGGNNTTALTLDSSQNATFAGNLTLSGASSPTITVTDTTNTVSLKMYSQDAEAIIGTYTNHPFKLFSNSSVALTFDTSQNATFAGTLDVDGASLTVGSSQQVNIVTSGSSLFPSLKVNNNGYIGSASATSAIQLLTSGDVKFAGIVGFGGHTPATSNNRADVKLQFGSNYAFGGAYSAFGENLNSQATVVGNNIRPVIGTNNQVMRHYNGSDAGNFMKIAYNKGVTFHTGLTTTQGTGVSEDTNERMRIDTSGNVGIGDTNPATELVVKSSDDTQVQIVSGASNDAYLSFLNGTIQHGFKQDNTGLFTLNYYGGGSTVERIAVRTDGKVGIGTTSPQSYYSKNLVVLTDGDGTGGLTLVSPATDDVAYYIFADGTSGAARYAGYVGYSHNDDKMFMGTAGTTRMTILSDGKTAIGSNHTPTHSLHVLSTDNKGFLLDRNTGNEPANLNEFSSYYSLSIKNRANGTYLNFGGGSSSSKIQATDGAGTATAKYLTLNPYGGRVGVGTTSPLFKLHVSGANTAIGVESTSTNQNSGIYFRAHGASQWETGVNITAGLNYEIYDRVTNLSRFVVDHSGGVMLGTTVAPSGTGLAVSSNINTSQITAIEIQQNTTGTKKAAAAFGVAIQNGGQSTNAADLTFHTASGGSLSERMRITSGGIVAPRHLSGQGYISFSSASGGGNYVNIKTNIYRASKMYTLLIIGHVSYSGERIHSIISGYAYAPRQGNTTSAYHGITNHGTIGVNVYYSSDDYLCIKTTGAGSYNSIDIIGSSGSVGYYQTNPIEVLAYTSIAGTGNHYA